LVARVAEDVIAEGALHHFSGSVVALALIDQVVEFLVSFVGKDTELEVVSAEFLFHIPPLFALRGKGVKVLIQVLCVVLKQLALLSSRAPLADHRHPPLEGDHHQDHHPESVEEGGGRAEVEELKQTVVSCELFRDEGLGEDLVAKDLDI
jgi:hypothetical protein